MLGWEMEAWAAWQVTVGEGSPLLIQSAWGPRVAWLEAVTALLLTPQWDSIPTSALQQPGTSCSWLARNELPAWGGHRGDIVV